MNIPSTVAARRGTRRLPVMALGACGLGMLLLYGVALMRFPLLSTYRTQVLTLDQQVVADPALAPALALGIGLLCLLYGAGYSALRAALRANPAAPQRSALLLIPAVALGAMGLLLLTNPTSSLDLYDYLYRGHIAARYGANNFVQTPEDFRAIDRLYWYTAWRRTPSAYGPLWEGLSTAVAAISGTQLLGLLLGFKLLAALGWLACGVAIAAAAPAGQRLPAAYLWLWNPLVLWELVGAGHNDSWMVLFSILACLVLSRRPALALLLVTAGALVKYALALLWPVLLVAALAGRSRRRISLILRAGLLSGALVVVAYLPWWDGPAMVRQLHARADLFTNSPLALARALWLPHGVKGEIEAHLAGVGLGLLAVGSIVAGGLALRWPRRAAPIGAGLLAWAIGASSPWVQPWYFVWPIALLALRPRLPRLWLALALLALGGLLVYPAYSALRPRLGWPGDGAAWQGLVLALLYLPALCALLWRRPQPWLSGMRSAPAPGPYQQESSP